MLTPEPIPGQWPVLSLLLLMDRCMHQADSSYQLMDSVRCQMLILACCWVLIMGQDESLHKSGYLNAAAAASAAPPEGGQAPACRTQRL